MDRLTVEAVVGIREIINKVGHEYAKPISRLCDQLEEVMRANGEALAILEAGDNQYAPSIRRAIAILRSNKDTNNG